MSCCTCLWNCSPSRLLFSCIKPIPILKENGALVQVEGLYPAPCALKYTVWCWSEAILCYLYFLHPSPLSTKLDNMLLVLLHCSRLKHSIVDIYDVVLLGPTVSEWKIWFGAIRVPYVPSLFFLPVARKGTISRPVYAWNGRRTHDLNVTSDIAIDHARMNRRWCTISNATHRSDA